MRKDKKEISGIFEDIEEATENTTLQDIIAKRYTAKSGELNPEKAHLRKGITYSSPKARISSYQSLEEEQLLEVNKVYAKLAILENENILKHVIPHVFFALYKHDLRAIQNLADKIAALESNLALCSS